MASTTHNPLIAVGQMTSTSDIEENFQTCTLLVEKAIARGCSFLSLPENFDFLGEKPGDARAFAEPLDGPLMGRYRSLARKGIWLSLGGFHEKHDAERGRNTHVVINTEGEIVAAYRKLHLFDIDIAGGPCFKESASVVAGNELVLVDSPIGRLGLSTCYDLRFPELYTTYRKLGAEVLLVPAAFTLITGKAHWETLLRARAIENQCYVAAAAQYGTHNSTRASYGHAMIVDPWGTVVANCSDKTDIAVAEIDREYMNKIRKEMPVFNHRRPEVYISTPRLSGSVAREQDRTAKCDVRFTSLKAYRTYLFDPNMTATQMIHHIASHNRLPNPDQYTLYVPGPDNAEGRWVNSSDTLKSLGLKNMDVLELKRHPANVSIILNDGTINDFQTAIRVPAIPTILIDYTDPLADWIPTIARVLNLRGSKEEYSFRHIYQKNNMTEFNWLNVNLSLAEQEVPYNSYILLCPLSLQYKRSVDSITRPEKEGWLNKHSVKEGKVTGLKKRWCIIKDNFFFYFTSNNASAPSGVIPLDYYIPSSIQRDGKMFKIELSLGTVSFCQRHDVYVLSSENERELAEWTKVIRYKTVNGADKRMFGVSLSKFWYRKNRTSDIPLVLEKTVRYIEANGLETVGIFRKSGVQASLEKCKDDFDSGIEPDLSKCEDIHTVCGLLKLYLRELPEPLLTFELYDKFRTAMEGPNAVATIRGLVQSLPEPNKRVLAFLLNFLGKVANFSSKNLMTLANLGTVFGPNLLRAREENTPALVHHATIISAIVELLIEQRAAIFGEEFLREVEANASPNAAGPAGMVSPRGTPATASALPPPPAVLLQQQDALAVVSPPPMSTPSPKTARALYDFNGNGPAQLSMRQGDVMRLVEKLPNGWIRVELAGRNGIVPESYVEVVEDTPAKPVAVATPPPPASATPKPVVPTLPTNRVPVAATPAPAATREPTLNSANPAPSPRTSSRALQIAAGPQKEPPNGGMGDAPADMKKRLEELEAKVAMLAARLEEEVAARVRLEDVVRRLQR